MRKHANFLYHLFKFRLPDYTSHQASPSDCVTTDNWFMVPHFAVKSHQFGATFAVKSHLFKSNWRASPAFSSMQTCSIHHSIKKTARQMDAERTEYIMRVSCEDTGSRCIFLAQRSSILRKGNFTWNNQSIIHVLQPLSSVCNKYCGNQTNISPIMKRGATTIG